VVSGVLVVGILAATRLMWHRIRVPSALSRTVRRRSYLGAVRAESERSNVERLDVYTPQLQPSRNNSDFARIQAAWRQIDHRGTVRVLTTDLDESLQAGAELLDMGIQVRVVRKRDLGTDGLSFHLFETPVPEDAIAIINHHRGGADRPIRITGVAPTEVYRGRFRTEWDKGRPLESVLAERIRRGADTYQGRRAVRRSIELAETTGLHLGPHSTEMILRHLAFRDSCMVVLFLGLPGAGKSYVRSRLAERLRDMHIEFQWLTDYPYAYLDLIRSALKLNSQNNGFKAYDGGAFAVQTEKSLVPALRALYSDVRDPSQTREVTLVEFARADLTTAHREFDEIRSRSKIVYVSAPAHLRRERLATRAAPPDVRVNGETISLKLSDNHLLPSSVESTLYAADDLERI
jgi:hypothetical protein